MITDAATPEQARRADSVHRVRQAVAVDMPDGEIVDVLLHRPEDWLVPFVRIAAHRGEEAGLRLLALFGRSALAPVSEARNVAAFIGHAGLRGEGVEIDVRLETTGYATVFPSLEGRFVISPGSPVSTLVGLEGGFAMPATVDGRIGLIVAELAAQTTVLDLLRSLRTALNELSHRGPAASSSCGGHHGGD